MCSLDGCFCSVWFCVYLVEMSWVCSWYVPFISFFFFFFCDAFVSGVVFCVFGVCVDYGGWVYIYKAYIRANDSTKVGSF